ncbi:MAG: hypothetical protein KF805_03625 [Phycisphaeraceae bacterium]|nr:hypothetical protein [Phycisphaeraceae bacterium]
MGRQGKSSFGPGAPPRLRLVAVETRESEIPAGEKNGEHPTRRPDGRTPNPRAAEQALAAEMNMPVETLEFLARREP